MRCTLQRARLFSHCEIHKPRSTRHNHTMIIDHAFMRTWGQACDGGAMTTFQAVMFGIMLALTPSLVALAFFLYREWLLTRDEEGAGRLELHK
jgi:hypothetical protein